MTHDEVFVSSITGLSQFVALCNDRLFHLEIAQTDTFETEYPCGVYQLVDNTQDKEISGVSGLSVSTYDLVFIAERSADLRALSAAVFLLSDETVNDATHATYPNVEWIDVDSDTEQNEFAIEQQENGYKTTTLTVTVYHSD